MFSTSLFSLVVLGSVVTVYICSSLFVLKKEHVLHIVSLFTFTLCLWPRYCRYGVKRYSSNRSLSLFIIFTVIFYTIQYFDFLSYGSYIHTPSVTRRCIYRHLSLNPFTNCYYKNSKYKSSLS